MRNFGEWLRRWATWLVVAVTLGVVVAMIAISIARIGS
jgi:hypothetical protein